jgi:hypothetical protein
MPINYNPPMGGNFSQKKSAGEGLLKYLMRQWGNSNMVMPSVGAMNVGDPLAKGASAMLKGGGMKMSPEMEAALAEASASTPEIAPVASRSLVNNASLQSGSGASAEALSRTASMASRGLKHVIRGRGGAYRPATEDGALLLRPGESFGILGPTGFQLLDSK